MADIAGEMENLRADVEALHSRMIVERELADYWYERCMVAEEQLHDALNNKSESKACQ